MAKRRDMPRQQIVHPHRVESPLRSENVPVKSGFTKVRVVNCSSLNIRRAPSRDGEIISTVVSGTEFNVDSSLTGEWVFVHSLDGNISGYAMRTFLEVQ